jgi:hypothetical protein
MGNLKLLSVLALFTVATSCSKKKEIVVPEVKVDPKGKFLITGSTMASGEDAYIYDIRDKSAPKRMVYQFTGGKFKLTNTVSLGAGGQPRDANWPKTWTNIKLLPGNGINILNMDTQLMYYSSETAGVTTVSKLADLFPFPENWKTLSKLSGGVNFREAYGNPESKVMGFYFDFATGDYLYGYDEFGPGSRYYTNYKISDLLKKSNGNVDVDPIDWSKSDLVFCFNNVNSGKPVTQFVFIDLDNNTYASFIRNKNDDPVKGADSERQTLLTTKWEPIAQIFENWPIK